MAWQSRKARDLLKILAARRGRPLTRDAAAEALWPNEHPGPLPNRLSVALSTLRKVLDPERVAPADHFIAARQPIAGAVGSITYGSMWSPSSTRPVQGAPGVSRGLGFC